MAALLSLLYRVLDAGGLSSRRSMFSVLSEPALHLMEPYRPRGDVATWPEQDAIVREAEDRVRAMFAAERDRLTDSTDSRTASSVAPTATADICGLVATVKYYLPDWGTPPPGQEASFLLAAIHHLGGIRRDYAEWASSQGAVRIAAERRRQVEAEGWSAAHDDDYGSGELVAAAICYAEAGTGFDLEISPRNGDVPTLWPWQSQWFKPSSDDLIRNLVKAGALIAAEIDRLIRAATAEQSAVLSVGPPQEQKVKPCE